MMQYSLNGRLWLSQADRSFLGNGRVELLEQIEMMGSISKAAKKMKMSYKSAWDAIDIMNTLSAQPLIERTSGGKGGGGSIITPYGKEVIRTYKILHNELQIFLHNLSMKVNDEDGHLKLLQTMSMRVSARNQLIGRIEKIEDFNLDKKIILSLDDEVEITVMITSSSAQNLNLKKGMSIYALFKASSLSVLTQDEVKNHSENIFTGVIEKISQELKQHEITILVGKQERLYVLLDDTKVQKLALKENQDISVWCNPKDIILGLF